MAGDNQRQIPADAVRGVDHLAIEGFEGALTVALYRQITWAQIGDRSTDRACSASLVTHGNEDARRGRLTGSPRHAPDEVDSVRVEEMLRELQAGGRVMVAADEHDLEMGTNRQRSFDKSIEPLLSGNGRVDCVIHVTGDDERVGLQFDQLTGQPVEECVMLDAAVESMELLAEMPVRRMDYAHGPHLPSQRASHCQHDIVAPACSGAGCAIELPDTAGPSLKCYHSDVQQKASRMLLTALHLPQ